MARKRRQTPAQRRASIKNLKKARAALRRRRPYRNWSSVGPYRARRGKKRRGVKGHRRRTNPAAHLLDRWESRGGRYWVEIRADGDGAYSVETDNSHGTFYSLEDARLAARDQVSYAPSKMRKVNRRTSNFASGMRYIHNLPPRARTTRTRKANRSGGRQQAVGGRRKQSRRAGGRGGCSVLEPVYSVRARRSVRSVEKSRHRRKRNPGETITIEYPTFSGGYGTGRKSSFAGEVRVTGVVEKFSRNVRASSNQVTMVVAHAEPAPGKRNAGAILPRVGERVTKRTFMVIAGEPQIAYKVKGPLAWAHKFIDTVQAGDPSVNLYTDWSRISESTYVVYKGYKFRFSDHALPERYTDRPDWDIGSARAAKDAAEWALAANPKSRIQNPKSSSPFAAEVARLRSDPTLQSASMRQHLRNVAKAPGSGRPRRSAAAREWKEFAGYEPNHVEKIDGVALKGNLPGVRVDVLEGVGAKTGRRVKIDAGQKPLYLVWFKSGERFAVTGGPSAMRELARDFSRLNEPIYLTKVDYVAPRYPVPEGVRRTKANAELSIAFTHAVENPTLMTWNGKLDPKHARFDIRVKGRRRRWVNRSGLIF